MSTPLLDDPKSPYAPSRDALFRLIADQHSFVLVLDANAIVRYMSPSGATILERAPHELLGQHAAMFANPGNQAAAREFLAHVIATPGRHGPVVGRAQRGAGGTVWLEAILDSTHVAAEGVIIMGRDVTEHIERDLLLQSHWLDAQRFEVIGRLASGVAHDLNNHLTVIAGYSNLLASQLAAGTSEQRQAEEARVAAEHAAGLVRQLHALGRATVGKMRECELGEEVERLRPLIIRSLGHGGVLTHEREQPVRLVFDPTSLEQALFMLALRLRDHHPGGAHMTVRTGVHSMLADEARSLGLAAGAYALAEARGECLEPANDPQLVMAAMRGVLGRVGGAVQMFLQPENVRVVRLLWPLTPVPALAPLAHLAEASPGQEDGPDSREGLFVLDAGRVPH